MKTGNTTLHAHRGARNPRASMEPGHEDREYQRNPVESETSKGASMEPGHEDREYHHTAIYTTAL